MHASNENAFLFKYLGLFSQRLRDIIMWIQSTLITQMKNWKSKRIKITMQTTSTV